MLKTLSPAFHRGTHGNLLTDINWDKLAQLLRILPSNRHPEISVAERPMGESSNGAIGADQEEANGNGHGR
jgi:hypothetical protein